VDQVKAALSFAASLLVRFLCTLKGMKANCQSSAVSYADNENEHNKKKTKKG
jgi:hypothetical protein